jgi:hypothetical protein
MSFWSWFHRRNASTGTGDSQAAGILTALLDGKLTSVEARARWPREPLSHPTAHSYLEYFEHGLDGKGMRDPTMDRVVRNLVTVLSRGDGQWNERTESWEAGGEPVDKPREARDAYYRMCISALAVRRANAETDPASFDVRTLVANAHALGETNLDPKERQILNASIGAVPLSLAMEMHWRIEVVGALAWSLGLVDEIPQPDMRFDYKLLDERVPQSVPEINAGARTAALLPVQQLLAMRARLRQERVEAFNARVGHENDRELSFRNSRALERYRAMQWLLNPSTPSLEATSATPGL